MILEPSPADERPPFAVEAREEDDQLVIALAGDLDMGSASQLRGQIDELPVHPDTVLDLSGLTFLDSAGIGCLYKLQQRVSDTGGLLVARGACDSVRRVLQISHLNRVMAILD